MVLWSNSTANSSTIRTSFVRQRSYPFNGQADFHPTIAPYIYIMIFIPHPLYIPYLSISMSNAPTLHVYTFRISRAIVHRTNARMSENIYSFTAEANDNKARFRCEASNIMSQTPLKTEVDVTVMCKLKFGLLWLIQIDKAYLCGVLFLWIATNMDFITKYLNSIKLYEFFFNLKLLEIVLPLKRWLFDR